ncbi:MAG TPA: AI-2E family transporter [Candidatus Angelobacter sp.]|nr:AI-2E family transporter [Candidatus Angelobacter sp.]
MTLFDKKTAQALFTALVFCLVLLFLYFAWRALIAFLFAILFAYLLEAPVLRLQKWFRGSKPLAITAVYLILIGVLVLVFSLLGPRIGEETRTLAQQTPAWANRISSGNIVQQLGERHGWSQDTVRQFTSFTSQHREQIISAIQDMVVRAVRTLQNTWWLILVPILAVFFLKGGDQFRNNLVNSVQNEHTRAMVASIVDKVSFMLGSYIRAQLLYSVLAMVVVTIVLRVMGVQYALALGPAEGALEFIPLVGPLIGGVLIMAVGFLSGYSHLLWLFIFLMIWRVVQDYVTAPRIMSGTLELHPLAVLFGVLAGGEVAGVIGIFLSVPVLAALRIVWHAWQFYGKPADPGVA